MTSLFSHASWHDYLHTGSLWGEAEECWFISYTWCVQFHVISHHCWVGRRWSCGSDNLSSSEIWWWEDGQYFDSFKTESHWELNQLPWCELPVLRGRAPLVCFWVTGNWSLFSDPLHTIKYVQYASWHASIQETGDNSSSDLKLAVLMYLIL